MLRLIGRERIFRCILRLGLRCGSRLLERLRLGHFAVNAAQGAVHAEQHHNKFIAEPCSNISDDKQQDRPEKVEKQQNNAVNSQRSDRHAVQDFQQTLGVCVPEIEKIMQLCCRAVVVIRRTNSVYSAMPPARISKSARIGKIIEKSGVYV